MIYIRQSSLRQLAENHESRHRQYQLVERAHALGWPAARYVVIDDDLGLSGARSDNRPSYQRLLSMLVLREVGLILSLEVSRLARNNLDGYQLLELAAAFDALIADEDSVYDPSDFNDRLLLGLRGTTWTARRAMDFRRSNGIPSGFTTTAALHLPETGYLTSAEVAQRLGVSQSTVQKWYRLGLLSGKHDGGPATLWIRWTDDLSQRLLGAATPDPRMVSMRALCQAQGQHPDGVLAWAQQHGHAVYRLRRGASLRFYVLPAQRPVPLQ